MDRKKQKDKPLTNRQQKAIQALLTHPTKKAAAEAAGISRTTLRKYLADPAFQREYRKATASVVDNATRRMQIYMDDAICCIHAIMEDKEETSGNRIMAARTILEYALKMTEFNEIMMEME